MPVVKKEARPKVDIQSAYQEGKQAVAGALLLFRMGDFYELFYEDAKIAAKVLGLTLTSRNKNDPNPIPLAGFPYHQLESYLAKLVAGGHRVGIMEQVPEQGGFGKVVERIVGGGELLVAKPEVADEEQQDGLRESIDSLSEVVKELPIEALAKVIKELKDAVETLSGEVENLQCRVSDLGGDLNYLSELPRTIDYLGVQLWRQNHLPLDGVNKKRK